MLTSSEKTLLGEIPKQQKRCLYYKQKFHNIPFDFYLVNFFYSLLVIFTD